LIFFLIFYYYRRFDENIEQQYDKWKKENEMGNVSATDNHSTKFQPKYPLIFKKTYYHSYLTWLSSLGFLGLHHLYLQNWIMLLGHILTLGGCGVFWIIDFCLMPSFIEYSNKKLGLIDEPVRETTINPNNIANGNDNDNKNDNNDVIITNVATTESDEVRHIQYNAEIEYQRALYTTYLYWTPLMGMIGVYYIYLGKYSQFVLRFFTLNFLFIGWLIDLFRIPGLVKTKLREEEAANNNNQTESLIK